MTKIPYESMTNEELEQEIEDLELDLDFEDYYAIDIDADALAMHKAWQDKIKSKINKLKDLLKRNKLEELYRSLSAAASSPRTDQEFMQHIEFIQDEIRRLLKE